MSSNIKIFLTLFVVALIGSAQQKMALTIEQAVQIGLENSKSLRTSQFRVQAAEAKASETATIGLPSLKVSGSYTRLSEVPPSAFDNPINPALPPIVIAPAIMNNYGAKATLQQPLFTGWKISGAEDAAEYSSEATKQDFQKDKADVIYNIKAHTGIYTGRTNSKNLSTKMYCRSSRTSPMQKIC